MKNTEQNLHRVLTTQRASLLSEWQKRVRSTSVLQLREDFDGHAPDDVLEEFFDLIVTQITTKRDYRLLRQRIFSGEINAFTPDAACRLLIALKKTILKRLKNFTHNAEAIFDEILLRISAYYHEMRYRNLARDQSQNLRQRNVEIARLLAVEKQRAAHLTTNNRIAQMALSTLDPDEIFRRIVHEVQQSFNYQHVSLYFVEPHSNQMIMKARAGVYEKHFPEGYRQNVGEGIVGHVVASGNPIMANDVANDLRRIIAFPQEKNTRSELCVPIKTADRVLGALDVLSRKKNGFNWTDVQSLMVLTDQLAWVIHNAHLFRETRELQDELVQSERLAVIGEMSAHIAHEIRNPLATIGGFARSLQRAPTPDRIDTASHIISREVTRLEELLTDILNYTRPRDLKLEPVNLPDLIAEVYHQVGEGLEGRGIAYRQNAPPDLPEIPLDPAQFKQVLINIFKNAFQAMPNGGKLHIDIQKKEDQPHIEIEIRDTGPGISTEIQDEIFKPYFTTKTTGTGLGLVISKQIVERHGGTLSFTSHSGSGTSLFIHLPNLASGKSL